MAIGRGIEKTLRLKKSKAHLWAAPLLLLRAGAKWLGLAALSRLPCGATMLVPRRDQPHRRPALLLGGAHIRAKNRTPQMTSRTPS